MERINFSREELYEMVWSLPVSHLLKQYDISQHTFRTLCKSHSVPLPDNGYWVKIRNNKPVFRKALPAVAAPEKPILLHARPQGNERPKTRSLSPLECSVPVKLSRPHQLTIDTQRHWDDLKGQRNSYDRTIPHLSIRVEKPNRKRALLLMDTFVKLLERRGHHIEFKYYRPHAMLYGVDIELDLREAAKRIPKPGSYPTFELEYTGEFVLMTGKYSINREWRDGKVKLEDMLDKVILWMESRARDWADWREQNRLAEAEREKEKENRDKLIARRQEELDALKKLRKDAKKHVQANSIRDYVAAVKAKALDDGSLTPEVQDYIQWAAKKADWLDPLMKSMDEILDMNI